MGRGRGRVAIGFVLSGLALSAAGCGTEETANDPRPQPPTRVSVTITPKAIAVQPQQIAIGAEPTQQIPQNQHVRQPPIRSKAPVDVVFVAANLTDFDSKLEVRGAEQDAHSELLVANGNVSLLTSLPTGVYTVSAADIPAAKPAHLTVGPYRTSSQNNVLQP